MGRVWGSGYGYGGHSSWGQTSHLKLGGSGRTLSLSTPPPQVGGGGTTDLTSLTGGSFNGRGDRWVGGCEGGEGVGDTARAVPVGARGRQAADRAVHITGRQPRPSV